MNLRNRLDNVTERGVLFQILKDVTNNPPTDENVVEIFCDSMDIFSKFLTDKEYSTVLNPVFDNQCPIRSIIGFSKGIATVSKLENPTTFRDVMTVLAWLRNVMEKSLARVICDSLKANGMDDDSVQLYRDFAKACMSIPEKVMNCCAKASTEENLKYIDSIKSDFQTHLLHGIQEALLIAHDKQSSNLKTVSELISASRNTKMNSRNKFLESLMESVGHLEPFDDRWKEIMKFIFMEPTILGVQVHEAFLTSVFLTARDEKALMRCIDTNHLSGTLRRVVMVKLPFQRVLKPRTIKILINFIHKTNETFGIELLETALKIWSDRNFARKSPEAQERHIVRIIVYSIHLFKKNPNPSITWNDLFLLSMEGIHSRSSMLPSYVQSALFINSTLSALVLEGIPEEDDPKSPPDFEKSEWTDELKGILEHGITKRAKRDIVVCSVEEDSGDEKFIEAIGERDTRPVDADSDDDYEDEDEEEEEGAEPVGHDPTRVGSLTSLASGVSLDATVGTSLGVGAPGSSRAPGPPGPSRAPGAPGPSRAPENDYSSSSEDEEESEVPVTNAERLQELSDSVEAEKTIKTRSPQLDSDDDEDFPTYRIDETEQNFKSLELGEEPKLKVPPPKYLADAFEMLLEKEKFEIFESAFFTIKSLIDRKAIGFNQLAEQLFVRVIHLQNHFAIKDFEAKADEIAAACITHRPEIVPALVRLLIAPGQSYPVQQRLLNCIHKAADEMGALDRRNEQFVLRQEDLIGGMTMNQVTDQEFDRMMFHLPGVRRPEQFAPGRAEAEARIAANTRRLGTTRERPRAGVVNRLAKAAKYMFYPLLVLPRGDNARLLGEDSDLLAYIIMVASMVYVRCGVNPAVAKMTIELIDYCRPHRFSDNVKLRSACLAAYLNVCALIPGNMLTDLFSIEVRQEWKYWAESIVYNHAAHEMEHRMAHQLHAYLKEQVAEHNLLEYTQPRLGDYN